MYGMEIFLLRIINFVYNVWDLPVTVVIILIWKITEWFITYSWHYFPVRDAMLPNPVSKPSDISMR